jgi:hypothetical protein
MHLFPLDHVGQGMMAFNALKIEHCRHNLTPKVRAQELLTVNLSVRNGQAG